MTDQSFDMAYESGWLHTSLGSERMVDSLSRRQSEPGRSVFLAHAFSRLLGADGTVDTDSEQKLTHLIDGFRAGGLAVHCSLEREGWGARLMTPQTALQLDMDQVVKADTLVSFPKGSPGAFLELGFRTHKPGPALLVKERDMEAEELVVIDTMLAILQEQKVPYGVIDDSSIDLQSFEAVTAPQIIDWVMEQAT